MIKFLQDRRVLITLIVLQIFTLIAVFFSWKQKSINKTNTEVLAEASVDTDEEYRSCLTQPVEEREVCARAIGERLATQNLSQTEKVKNCMKLRPTFYRFCLDELRQSL